MGQRAKRIMAEILGIRGWAVEEAWIEDEAGKRWPALTKGLFVVPASAGGRLVLRLAPMYAAHCGHCNAVRCVVHELVDERRWRDLPWGPCAVEIAYAPRRLECSHCGKRCVEALPWAAPHQRATRRLQNLLAVQCSSSPVLHVAAMHGMNAQAVRRAEKAALERWAKTRKAVPLEMVGVDEKWLGRRHGRKRGFVTIVSNLATGEPLWIGIGRGSDTLAQWIATLSADQKKAIKLFAMDMHEPFRAAVRADGALAHAAIVHDPFHVMKLATEILNDVRKDVFFRAGPAMRRLGRGTRWLVLKAWERCTSEEQHAVNAVLSMNATLARAWQIVDELRTALGAPTRDAMDVALRRVLRRTASRRHPALRRLHDSILNHREAILSLAELRPPVGRIEALNNNWETLVRRGRGYRDLSYLLLKLRFATAHPIRSRHDIGRLLALEEPAVLAAAA